MLLGHHSGHFAARVGGHFCLFFLFAVTLLLWFQTNFVVKSIGVRFAARLCSWLANVSRRWLQLVQLTQTGCLFFSLFISYKLFTGSNVGH